MKTLFPFGLGRRMPAPPEKRHPVTPWPAALAMGFAASLAAPACALGEVPVDNPVATHYSGAQGYPAWTHRIAWSRVIDMSAYSRGKTNFERFENARDELAARGGGVLYYPAGEYDFSDGPFDGPEGRGLMLRSGVVIRGETPTLGTDARAGRLGLRTKFIFGGQVKRRRFRLTLPGAIPVTRTSRDPRSGEVTKTTLRYDVRLDFRIEAGAPHPDVFLEAPGLLPHRPAQAEITSGADGWTVRIVKAPDQIARTPTPSLTCQAHVPASLPDGLLDDAGPWSVEYTATGETASAEGRARYEPLPPSVVPRDWNLIGLAPEAGRGVASVRNVGIVWVHMVRAAIYFGPEMKWAPTWGQCTRRRRDMNVWSAHYRNPEGDDTNARFLKPAWRDRVPDGTHPWDPFTGSREGPDTYVGAGQGRLVFGCVLEDAAVTNDSHDLGAGADSFYMMKFGARIAAYGSRLFVANNVLPKSRHNFLYSQRTFPTSGGGAQCDVGALRTKPRSLLWDYGKTCGLDINKDLVGLFHKAGLYEPGVVVRDNWFYNHGQKGYNVSGTWVTLVENVNQRDFLREGDEVYGLGGRWELTIDGALESSPGGGGPISDNYSRAFDLGGRHVWVDGNWFINNGSDPGNDGEAILCQSYRGTQWHSWAVTHNTHIRGEGEDGYIGGWAVEMLGTLIAWNVTPGRVGALANRLPLVDAAIVHEHPAAVEPKPGESVPGGTHDVVYGSDGRPLTPPADVRATPWEGDAVQVSWTDASDNEIGFRVDRRIGDGDWATIAYRPRRGAGSAMNPQAWIDFTAPPGRDLRYRVVAISEHDDHSGAAARVEAFLEDTRTGPVAADAPVRSVSLCEEGKTVAIALPVTDARALEAEDPADPRAAWVLAAAAKKAGDGRAAADAQAALDALLKEPGVPARLVEFEALTQGRYAAPMRLHPVSPGRTP